MDAAAIERSVEVAHCRARESSHHLRGELVPGEGAALRGAGAGDEGGAAEDVLLRALVLAVCTADFG